jgi:hypothetical protein
MEMGIYGLKKEKEKKTKPQNTTEIFRSCKLKKKEQPGNSKPKIQRKYNYYERKKFLMTWKKTGKTSSK